MDAEGASVVLSLFLNSETNKGKTTNMKTKLKKVVPSASCLVLSAKKMLAVALCAVGLAAFAEESVTINEVKSVQPWDKAKGTITVDYSLGGLDAAKEYKVAFDITANGVTKGVTNAAAKLTSGPQTVFTYDTVSLFGAETRAEDAKVKVSLIAIKPKAKGGFQLWEGGPIWAEANLGEPEEHEPSYPSEYGAIYWFDTATNEVAKLGDGWRLPTKAEFGALISNCGKGEWTNQNGVYGRLFKGTGDYASNSIFLPAAGYKVVGSRSSAGADGEGYYWSSTEKDKSTAYRLSFEKDDANTGSFSRYFLLSARAVRDAK